MASWYDVQMGAYLDRILAMMKCHIGGLGVDHQVAIDVADRAYEDYLLGAS